MSLYLCLCPTAFTNLQDEMVTLDAAYGAGFRQISVDGAVRTAIEQYTTRFNVEVHKPELSEGILSRAQRYGKTCSFIEIQR